MVPCLTQKHMRSTHTRGAGNTITKQRVGPTRLCLALPLLLPEASLRWISGGRNGVCMTSIHRAKEEGYS